MQLHKGNRYLLRNPAIFDDAFGKGFGYVEPVATVDSKSCYVVDCYITKLDGERHPGIEYPVPVRLEDISSS